MQSKTGLKRVKTARDILTRDGNTSSVKLMLNIHQIKTNLRSLFQWILQQDQEYQEQYAIKSKTIGNNSIILQL